MNWSAAPDWAQYYTVDERGAAYWWEHEPRYSGVRWWSFTGRTQRAENSTGKTAAYHIVYRDGQYKVFDKAQRFRIGFATLPAAQTYIASRTAAASHNNALSDERQAVTV